MKFFLVVGEGEKHVVEYSSNSLTGSFCIKVDESEVKRQGRFFFRPSKESHTMDVGRNERCEVAIHIERTFFTEKTSLYVNGRLARSFSSTPADLQQLQPSTANT